MDAHLNGGRPAHPQQSLPHKMTFVDSVDAIIKEQQQLQEQKQAQYSTPVLKNLIQHERVFVPASPASLTRGRSASMDSTCSISSISASNSEGCSAYATPRSRDSIASNPEADGSTAEMSESDQMTVIGDALQSDLHKEEEEEETAERTPSLLTEMTASYNLLLKQIADQRAKLDLLHSGAETLSKNASVLDDALEKERNSMDIALQGAKNAMGGWEDTWSEHSKCESLESIQEQPAALSRLIKGMNWQDKKCLFEQLVANCGPRETYQLQHQISIRNREVLGFDLLEECPSHIWSKIMKFLSFTDLANCRMVSRSWHDKATTYDVVTSAVNCLMYAGDATTIEPAHPARKNWNQLCRYQERESRWRRSKPVSVYAMTGHSSYVTSLKDCGQWIISGGYDEKVRLWDTTTGKCARIWEVDSAVSCVELLVDEALSGGGVVAAAFVDIGLVKVWSLHGQLNMHMHTLTGHQKGVRALAINEKYLASAGFDQTVLVWSWSNGRKVASFRAHNEVILSVHLARNTVYTVCIDATLRVFDIPSRSLLHQVKLFEVPQGSTLQWSCLRETMLITSTNKAVYVWQLEHLENLVRLQVQQCFSSAMTLVHSDFGGSGNNARDDYLDDISSPSMSPTWGSVRSVAPSSLGSAMSPPLTPAFSMPTFTPGLDQSSASIYSSLSESNSSPYFSAGSSTLSSPYRPSPETRIKPCLTAVLTMAMDMWCGKVTHHDPPLLILGSRSSAVKLATVRLTKDIIDPCKVYESDHEPLHISPRAVPIEGLPAGHGRGIMCIDSSAGRLVVDASPSKIHFSDQRYHAPSSNSHSDRLHSLCQSCPPTSPFGFTEDRRYYYFKKTDDNYQERPFCNHHISLKSTRARPSNAREFALVYIHYSHDTPWGNQVCKSHKKQ
ncbi:hypothetical protein BGX28_002440 [Mortierella sp. GBA30]|nr:hypothetical protein BGX28_002440 [Mortierella sp. GBA30]